MATRRQSRTTTSHDAIALLIDDHDAVSEEQGEMFPKLRGSSMDMESIGRELERRRSNLESAKLAAALAKPTIWDRLLMVTPRPDA